MSTRRKRTMFSGREVAAPPAPTSAECPKCKGTKLVPLAADEDKQRVQCASEDCGEHFSLPISLAKTVFGEQVAEPPREDGAGESLDCPKCARPFQRRGFYRDRHIEKCDGTPLPPRTAEPERPARVVGDEEGERGPSLKKRVISFIRRERDFHTDQADFGRRLIDAIAEVPEEGGE